MPAERSQQIEQLYHQARERDPRDRAAFLEQACAGDAALRRELESLLAEDDRVRSFLETPALELAKKMSGEESGQSMIGRQFGPYSVVSLLAKGGMGEVYRARDTQLQRDVALKVLPKIFASDAERLARFQREAQVLAALNHPNIAQIYGLEGTGTSRCIVMELVDGTTLRDLLADGPLPLKRTMHIGVQVADGLAKAHGAGIVHRDLKPENVMITRDGVAKILDFGLAKLAEPEVDNEDTGDAVTLGTRTEAGAILGTPGYMSPEQASGRSADFRSDQFSFGAIVYEMVTGKRAFQRDTNVETLSAIIRDEPIPVSAINLKTPAPLRWIIERCMAKQSEDRYASTLDLARELQSMRDHFPELAGWDTSSSPAPPRVGVSRRLRVLAAGGSAVLAILLIVLLRNNSARFPTFRQLTFGHGLITCGRFAPDGQSVIYGADWVGQGAQIYTTRPRNPESRSLGLNNAGIWSVSSSGEMAISYPCMPSWDGCTGTLALVPSTGGAPREILDNVHDADWAPDGKTLVVAQFAGGNDRIVLYPSGNVLYETRGWVRHVRVSPKGGQIAFLDHPVLGLIGGSVCVIDFTGNKNKKVLSSGWSGLRSLAWSPSGGELWFTASGFKGKGVLPNLFGVTPAGKERTLLSVPMYTWIHDIFRDGQVLLQLSRPRAAMIALASGAEKERDFSWFDLSVAADLSADGKVLLFYEYGGAVDENRTIYLRKTDGSDAKRLGEGTPLALSPDGQWALALQHTVPPQLVLLPTGIGKPKPLPRGVIGEFLDWAGWSPDGSRVFFTAIEQGHRARTYVQDIDGGLPQAVTPEGMAGTLLAPDGKLIAAVDRYQQYYLCPVDGGEPSPLDGYDDGDVLLQWSSDGRAIFLRGLDSKELKIYRLDLRNGTKTLWKDLTPPNPAGLMSIGENPGQVRISPDGKSYVYTVWTSLGELYMVDGLR